MRSVVLVKGDGIGPEISDVVVSLLQKVGAKIDFIPAHLGKEASAQEITDCFALIRKHKIVLKGPTETPSSIGGSKSFNVTVRKGFEQSVSVRRCASFYPVVDSHFPQMDLLFVRENIEDLYAAIEYDESPNVKMALRLMSHQGCEKAIRIAFELALQQGRKTMLGLEKPNILKNTGGLFEKIFWQLAKEYEPHITSFFKNIDDGLAELAVKPEKYDAVVTSNIFGDIGSDITAKLAGGVGLVGSANIGQDYAMFEAMHGTAPDIAGKNLANPTALLMAAIDMLVHIGDGNQTAARHLYHALLWTLQDGVHTGDIRGAYQEEKEKETSVSLKRGCHEFGDEIAQRLEKIKSGQKVPEGALQARCLKWDKFRAHKEKIVAPPMLVKAQKTDILGMDVFIEWHGLEANILQYWHQKTGLNYEDILNVSHFHTTESVREYISWGVRTLKAGLSFNNSYFTASIEQMPAPEALALLKKYQEQGRLLTIIALQSLAQQLQEAAGENYVLQRITNRGQEVWPSLMDPYLVDHQRCRFLLKNQGTAIENRIELAQLVQHLVQAGIAVVHTQLLQNFTHEGGVYNGATTPGFSTAYGALMGERIDNGQSN
ncbi:MAG: isocitrate/isopropylmalate family dehydrogenase [Alphaproteobacteria bacterium]